MAIKLEDSFQVAAPISDVWEFFQEPNNIVTCMPGASLKEIVDPQHFVGAVKVKIGAISALYQGSIAYQEVDPDQYRMTLLAKGNERGGGTVTGTIKTQLRELDDGPGTEVSFTSAIDLTGRMAQVGRGMIDGVSAQIIKKFTANVRAMVEPSAEQAGDGSEPVQAPLQVEDSINIFAVVLKVLWEKLRNFVIRVFGSKPKN